VQLTEEVAPEGGCSARAPRWHSADPALSAMFLQKDAE